MWVLACLLQDICFLSIDPRSKWFYSSSIDNLGTSKEWDKESFQSLPIKMMISNTTVIPFLKKYIDCSTVIVVDYEGTILYSDQCVGIENKGRKVGNRVLSSIENSARSHIGMEAITSSSNKMESGHSVLSLDDHSRYDCSHPIEMIDNSCFAVYFSLHCLFYV